MQKYSCNSLDCVRTWISKKSGSVSTLSEWRRQNGQIYLKIVGCTTPWTGNLSAGSNSSRRTLWACVVSSAYTNPALPGLVDVTILQQMIVDRRNREVERESQGSGLTTFRVWDECERTFFTHVTMIERDGINEQNRKIYIDLLLCRTRLGRLVDRACCEKCRRRLYQLSRSTQLFPNCR